ncbi:ABC transporter permease [candidate division CSSED10-310 bacterium]|uniref:ABC transporter permease n=1 Tax=candidate division CSSED10-310 bacterium TaxID=2855610 RepID=A0ABV6YRZ6_UNCC1
MITATSLLVGVAMIIFAHGFMDGLDNSVVEGQIRYDSGHLRLTAPGLLDDEEDLIYEKFMQNPGRLKEQIKQQANVTLYERLLFKAELSDGVHSLMTRGVGVYIDLYFEAFQLKPDQQLATTEYHDMKPIWIGKDLGRIFQVKEGDTLTILTRTLYGSYTADDFILAGLINSTNPLIDNFSIFLRYDDAAELLDAQGTCSDLVGFLAFREAAVSVKTKLTKLLKNIEVQTWQENAEAMLSINRFRRKVFGIINAIILAIVATSIANTVVMSCFERIREIGTLKALGYPRASILFLLLTEAFIIGMLGAIAGIILGGGLTYYLELHGIDFGEMIQTMEYSVSLSVIIYTIFSVRHVIFAFSLGMVITLVSAFLPAWRFSRLSPVNALHR